MKVEKAKFEAAVKKLLAAKPITREELKAAKKPPKKRTKP